MLLFGFKICCELSKRLDITTMACYKVSVHDPGFITPVVPNLGPPDVLGLQLPEAFTTTSADQDFWELKSKNIWGPKVGDQCIAP